MWLVNVEKEISAFRREFKLATTAIHDAIGKEGTGFGRWAELSDAYFNARSALRNLIPIAVLEKKLKNISNSK